MAGCDSMGRGLEPFLARFWNFLLEKLSREFKLRRMSIFHEIQKMAISRYCVRLQLHGWNAGIVVQVLCMLIWPWSDPRWRLRSRGFQNSENCRKLHCSRSISSAILAWSSKLMVDHDSSSLQADWVRFSNFDPLKLAGEFKLRGMSILHEFQMVIFPYWWWLPSYGRARWYYYTCCAYWCDLDLIQGQGH